MMWPRLQLLKELLSDDGVIFVSIDSNEQHRLRMILDEIWGEENYIGTFVWEGTGKNDSKFISVSQDYIFTYSKNLELLKTTKGRWRVLKEGLVAIYDKEKELRGKYKNNYQMISEKLQEWFSSLDKTSPSWKHRHYNIVDERGIFFPGDISWPGGGGPTYDIIHPVTKKSVKKPGQGWRFPSKNKMLSMIEDNRIYFGDSEKRVPKLKRYLNETEHQVLNSVIYKDRRAAHKNLKKILGIHDFEYPKDESVLKVIFEAVSEKNDIILDSFAGSGTTAHAVLDLNKEDGGNRKFILAECEDYADTITAERVRRVIKGVPNAKDEKLTEGLGGSFTYCTLGDEINVENMILGKNLPDYKQLAKYVFYTANGEKPR